MSAATQSSQSFESFTERDYNELSYKIIECCMEVHRELGPGLMESVYEVCAVEVMKKEGLNVKRQVSLPVAFKGERLNKEFVIDVLVNDKMLKSVEDILPVHEAQLVTYLKLADKKPGLLINFNVPLLKDGIKRRINGNLNSTVLH